MKTDKTQTEIISWYTKEKGFTEIKTTPQGTTILKKGNRIIRIKDFERGYDIFATRVKNKLWQYHNNMVKIYSHKVIYSCAASYGLAGNRITITRMEVLENLTENEAAQYKTWIKESFKKGVNFHGILDSTTELYNYAKQEKFPPDLVQPKNIMKRGNMFIHIDPFQ